MWRSGLCLAFYLFASSASAEAIYVSQYTFDQTMSAATRLLRVDLGLKIVERDVDNGYLIFEYTSPESGKRTYRGTLEVIRSETPRVTVNLRDMPQYHEQMIVDALDRKLHAENGELPKREKAPKEKEVPKQPEKSPPPTSPEND